MPGFASSQKLPDGAARQQRLEDAALVTRRLAHDFGNVLTGILGFSELSLTLLSKDSPSYRHVAEIHRAAQQGAEFTQGLQWFSRRGQLRSGTSVLADVLSQELSRLRSLGGGKLAARLDVRTELPPVGIDGEELRQVIRRALDNAREALDGPGTVTLSARLVDLTDADCPELLGNCTPGAYVELAVTDTGHGLSEEVLRRALVEPFFSSKPNHRGMGLAVIYGILHCHRGGLRLNARAEGGAELKLYLPVSGRPSPTPAPTVADRPGRGERVLVVDDDPIVLQLVCGTLESAGYRTHAATSGAEAECCYTAVGGQPFQLVLSDLLMPRMSGVELARRLLKHDANVNLLFMSGQPSADGGEAIPDHWRFGVLTKPFRPDSLVRAVRAALDQRSLGMPASPRGLAQEGLISSSR
jgi:CheY-like chemotaxis protein